MPSTLVRPFGSGLDASGLIKKYVIKKIQSLSGLQGRPSIGKRHGKVKAVGVIFTSFIEFWWASTKMVASIFCFFLSHVRVLITSSASFFLFRVRVLI